MKTTINIIYFLVLIIIGMIVPVMLMGGIYIGVILGIIYTILIEINE